MATTYHPPAGTGTIGPALASFTGIVYNTAGTLTQATVNTDYLSPTTAPLITITNDHADYDDAAINVTTYTRTGASATTPAANYGHSVLFKGQDAGKNTAENMAEWRHYWSTATAASETSATGLYLRSAGAALALKYFFNGTLATNAVSFGFGGTSDGFAADGAGNLHVFVGGGSRFQFTSSAVGTVNASAFNLDNGSNFVFGSGSGTKIGTATTQLFAFHNAAPCDQAAAIADATDAATAISQLNLLLAAMREKGLIAT